MMEFKSGSIIFDQTVYSGKPLGVVTMVDGVPGSLVDANFALGTPWAIPMPTDYYIARGPTVSVTGTTLSWSWPAYSGGADFTLRYGIY